MVTFARRIHKSKPFCNLTPCKSTRQRRVRSTPGHIKSNFRIDIFEWKCLLLNHFDLKIPKCHFYFCAMSRNAKKRSCGASGTGWRAAALPLVCQQVVPSWWPSTVRRSYARWSHVKQNEEVVSETIKSRDKFGRTVADIFFLTENATLFYEHPLVFIHQSLTIKCIFSSDKFIK